MERKKRDLSSLKDRIRSAGFSSNKDLAKAIGISKRSLDAYMRGERDMAGMSFQTAIRLSRILRISAEELMELIGGVDYDKEYTRIQKMCINKIRNQKSQKVEHWQTLACDCDYIIFYTDERHESHQSIITVTKNTRDGFVFLTKRGDQYVARYEEAPSWYTKESRFMNEKGILSCEKLESEVIKNA